MRIISYVCSILILIVILLPGCWLDHVYHNSEIWHDGISLWSNVCDWLYQRGVSYTEAFGILKSSFGILVTAISMIVTMSVNISNRSESKVFGLSREKLTFSRRTIIYQHGRRIIFLAPMVMIIAVNFELCITGYSILAISYIYLLLSYFLFDSSFSRKNEEKSVIKNLLNSVPDDVQDAEDIGGYLTYLNSMRQWNEKEGEWEATEHLFLEICNIAKEYGEKKMYFLCFYFYEVVFVRNSCGNMDRAISALKSYINNMDKIGWKEKGQEYYLILWEMIHCLFMGGTDDEVVSFIKWYSDFPMRSKRILRKTEKTINHLNMSRQMGVLLIELELYFSRNELQNNYILKVLPYIWNQGKYFFKEPDRVLIEAYKSINGFYYFCNEELEGNIANLYYDYKNKTSRSMTKKLLQYKLEE